MSRYGDRFKDDLFDEIMARYEDSHLTLTEFVTVLLEVIADFVRACEWPKD